MIYNYKQFVNENQWINHDFNMGDCDIYAVALHRLYNLPLYTVRNYYPNGEYSPNDEKYEKYGIDFKDSHIVVKLDNGKYLDSSGEMTKKELINQCIFGNKIGEIKIIPIDEDEALSIFGGCDYDIEEKINDIHSIQDYIKEYKPLK